MEQDAFDEWITELGDLTDEQLEELKEAVMQEIGVRKEL